MRALPNRQAAGFTLIEAMISLVVLLIAALAMMSMQVIGTRTNQFGNRMVQASSLATDLEETMKLWPYTDSRLTPMGTALTGSTALSDATLAADWELGRSDTTAYAPEYSDNSSDTNASTAGALGTTYTGLSTDVDGDGTPDFTRYWNVWEVDFGNTGTPDGKFVQIIVRWREDGIGWRQLTASTFRRNPEKVLK
jgi:Tfp pilus assembly protein PilV